MNRKTATEGLRTERNTRGPYGLEIIESCTACPISKDGLFCHLPPATLAELDAIRQIAIYPKGSLLFVETEAPRGIFILCAGCAKLTTSSPTGREVILRLAERGEVLGLSAAMANVTYGLTAETLEPCQVNFLPRAEFLRLLQRHPEVARRVAHHLSSELHTAYTQIRRMALAPTARIKLAGLLRDWAQLKGEPTARGLRFRLPLTHSEIGELIGASRETVTRLLGDFQRAGILQVKGNSFLLIQLARLETLLAAI